MDGILERTAGIDVMTPFNWLMTDMNSYFASVEQMQRPELRDRPVAVIPLAAETTSVIAASRQAKVHGVKTGTKVSDARRMCPGIVMVLARPKEYVKVHHQILESVDKCAPVHRVYSIDEWAIQLRGVEREPAAARSLAQRIQQQLLKDFGPCLTCSIGIAPTRLLAKIASDLQKPNGLTLLGVDDLPQRIEHLNLTDLCGISSGIQTRLNRHGVTTVRDLWNVSRSSAACIWGSVSGSQWWDGLHGVDHPEIPTRRSSMTHGNVLEPRFRTDAGARGVLIRLVCRLGERLRRNGYLAWKLRLSLRDVRGGQSAQEIPLPGTDDTHTLLAGFHDLWRQRPARDFPILKVDVTVCGLQLASQISPTLFGDLEKRRRVSKAIDEINARCGETALYFGAAHDHRHLLENKIAFGRIPDNAPEPRSH